MEADTKNRKIDDGGAQERNRDSRAAIQCLVLFVDMRDSTAKLLKGLSKTTVHLDRLEWLRSELVKELGESQVKESWLKCTGDGWMFVWTSPYTSRARQKILEVTVKVHQHACDTKIFAGFGLAEGDLYEIQVTLDFQDYIGEAANVAAKLQGAARPHGIVVHRDFFEDITNDEIPEGMIKQQLPRAAELRMLQEDECLASKDVVFALNWTCLSWPGVVRDQSDADESWADLNTKGITVVTHEGLEGKLHTLTIWPRNSLSMGDHFELIIDDFDALAILEERKALNLCQREHLHGENRDLADIYQRRIPRALRAGTFVEEKFFFIPIRCGINALACRESWQDKGMLNELGRYRDLRHCVKSKEWEVGLYDNLGATLPILLLMYGPDEIKATGVYAMKESDVADAIHEFLDDTEVVSKMTLYSRVTDLARALLSDIDVALGGGAWLGPPAAAWGGERINVNVPKIDGGFLWTEGAAIANSAGGQARHLVRFVADHLLSDEAQRRLSESRPYPACPVVWDVIKELQQRAAPESDQSMISSEVRAIFIKSDERLLSSFLTHRQRPGALNAWLEAWEDLKKKLKTGT